MDERRCPNGGSFGCPEGTPCKYAPVCKRVGFWVPNQMASHNEFRLKIESDIPEELQKRLLKYGFEKVSEREFVLYPATAEELNGFDGICPHEQKN